MPTIRIDQEVYSWLKSKAIPFEDTPNTVLRRIAGLDALKVTGEQTMISDSIIIKEKGVSKKVETSVLANIGKQRLTGKYLSRIWHVDVAHALYHQDGTFYENLHDFPGALFDLNGYVVFKTEREYNSSPYLSIGQKLNVHEGISTIPGYKTHEVKR